MNAQALITTLSAIIVTSISVVAWAYEKFDTKEAAKERAGYIENRLERIEQKLDRLLERKAD